MTKYRIWFAFSEMKPLEILAYDVVYIGKTILFRNVARETIVAVSVFNLAYYEAVR